MRARKSSSRRAPFFAFFSLPFSPVVRFFPPSFFLFSRFLTCSRQRERAREYILGGKSELEGAERKRAIRAERADGDADEDFVDLDDGFEVEGKLLPAAATCARTRTQGLEKKSRERGAPLELRWAAIWAAGRERERERERECESDFEKEEKKVSPTSSERPRKK